MTSLRPMLLVLAGALAVAAPCAAVPLVAGRFVESLSGGGPSVAGTSIRLPEEINRFFETAGGVSAGHARTTGGAAPSAELWLGATAPTRSDGLAEVTYQFAVERLGPGAPSDLVPVHVSAHGSASARSEGTYRAFVIASAQIGAAFASACVGCAGEDVPDFSLDEEILVAPDRPVNVRLVVFGEIAPRLIFPTVGEGEVAGFSDPLIEIAPDYPLRDHFRIVFSTGVTGPASSPDGPAGPADPVAAPAALLLVAAGIVVLQGVGGTRHTARRRLAPPRGSSRGSREPSLLAV
jgi:hypothetical protein